MGEIKIEIKMKKIRHIERRRKNNRKDNREILHGGYIWKEKYNLITWKRKIKIY